MSCVVLNVPTVVNAAICATRLSGAVSVDLLMDRFGCPLYSVSDFR
jgi:hypothetical protein